MDFAWRVIATLGGATAIILALVAVAYWLFQTFSERWLQSKFDERLENLKHAQNQEIEQFRSKIGALMDRATKLHEREYQILPELWESLASAWGETAAFVSPVQSHPDANRMSDEELDEHLERSELYDSQKQKVRDSHDRTKTLADEEWWHRRKRVHDHARVFSRGLRFRGIFLAPEAKKLMSKAADMMWDALFEHDANKEDRPGRRERDSYELFSSEGKLLLDEIERMVHQRLWTITKLD